MKGAENTVLFDIGGVLTHDGHETYLLHPQHGLVKSGLTDEQVLSKTAPIFRKYAVLAKARESDFWSEISKALGISLRAADIQIVKNRLRYINDEAMAAFAFLREHNINIGVISNSVPFFYSSMSKQLSLSEHVDKDLFFLSHEEGLLKSGGLFEAAAAKLNPPQTFIIDDREKNVAFAKAVGFKASRYTNTDGSSLLKLVKNIHYKLNREA